MLKEISVWLCGRVPGLTRGANLQIGYREDTAPVRCHTVLETGGTVPIFGLTDRIDYLLQVVSRAADYQTARADAWKIFDAIDGTAGWRIAPLTSGGQAYEAQTIEAQAVPQWIGQDEKGNHELSTNYVFRMKKANT